MLCGGLSNVQASDLYIWIRCFILLKDLNFPPLFLLADFSFLSADFCETGSDFWESRDCRLRLEIRGVSILADFKCFFFLWMIAFLWMESIWGNFSKVTTFLILKSLLSMRQLFVRNCEVWSECPCYSNSCRFSAASRTSLISVSFFLGVKILSAVCTKFFCEVIVLG